MPIFLELWVTLPIIRYLRTPYRIGLQANDRFPAGREVVGTRPDRLGLSQARSRFLESELEQQRSYPHLSGPKLALLCSRSSSLVCQLVLGGRQPFIKFRKLAIPGEVVRHVPGRQAGRAVNQVGWIVLIPLCRILA